MPKRNGGSVSSSRPGGPRCSGRRTCPAEHTESQPRHRRLRGESPRPPEGTGGHSDERRQRVDSRSLEPRTGWYVEFPKGYRYPRISPAGRLALVRNDHRWEMVSLRALAGGHATARGTIPERLSGQRDVGLFQDLLAWSGDSRRVLVPYAWGVGCWGFRIYDVTTHRLSRFVQVPRRGSDGIIAWGRSDNEVAVGHDPNPDDNNRAGNPAIRFFDLTGRTGGLACR